MKSVLHQRPVLGIAILLVVTVIVASCGGPLPPTATLAPAPSVNLDAIRTQAAMDAFATLTASAPALQTVSTSETSAALVAVPPSTATEVSITATAPGQTDTATSTPTSTPVLPTQTRTFTPAPPSPTPPRLLAANLGGAGDLIGRLLYIDTGGAEPVYSTQMYFEVLANNPKVGSGNGAGIDKVEFAISDDRGITVYRHTERTPRYCSFGGDVTCNWFAFSSSGLRWPDSDQKIQGVDLRLHNATYHLDVSVRGQNGDELSGSVDFRIQCAGCPN